ncbi:ABC-type bacteriocin/lantibiotic exporter with double-glycine peptidase domain [Metabacillus crassostreae]|nr:ABC-type bacteriocin/lantibiotic exporter with double-glycine peptidase domain [Metabacillus crassostreae]
MFRELTNPFKYERIGNKERYSPSKKKQKISLKEAFITLGKLWNYLSNKLLLFTLVLIMVVVSSVLGLLGPYLIGTTIDNYFVTKDEQGLLFVLGGLVLVFVFYSISLFLQNYWMIGILNILLTKCVRIYFSIYISCLLPFLIKGSMEN